MKSKAEKVKDLAADLEETVDALETLQEEIEEESPGCKASIDLLGIVDKLDEERRALEKVRL